MKLIVHRGIYEKKVKENTLEGIIKGFNDDKYDGVEFDVRVSLDGVFFLYHDFLYKGKLVSKMNYNELPKYIPTLESILSINTKKIFLLEIKNIDGYQKEFIKLLNKFKNKNIYIMSFDSKLINSFAKLNLDFKVGVLNYLLNSNDITNLDFICLLNRIITDDIINLLKQKNIEVFSYGIFKKNIKMNKDIYYIVDDN